jgi:hypothetical protein
MAGVGGWGRFDVRLTRLLDATVALSGGLLLCPNNPISTGDLDGFRERRSAGIGGDRALIG